MCQLDQVKDGQLWSHVDLQSSNVVLKGFDLWGNLFGLIVEIIFMTKTKIKLQNLLHSSVHKWKHL